MDDTIRLHNQGTLHIHGYQIIEEIGRGGMAVVYKALQVSLGRYVALKILAPYLSADPELVKRFQREAKAAALMRHPNIVTIYDVGEADGYYFIVMEYVEGKSLKEYLRERGALPPKEAVRILKDVASALDYAHKHGFVHRDVKPSNVLIDGKTGRALLTDFGVVKALHGKPHLTRTGAFIGTVRYASPEQIQEKRVGTRSDLYSFGIMAYEMLSGHLPFDGSVAAIMLAHVKHPPPVLRDFPESNNVFRKALAKSPDNRYESALAFVDDLGKALRGQKVGSIKEQIKQAGTQGGRRAWTDRWLIFVSIAVVAVALVWFAHHTRLTENRAGAGNTFRETPTLRPAWSSTNTIVTTDMKSTATTVEIETRGSKAIKAAVATTEARSTELSEKATKWALQKATEQFSISATQTSVVLKAKRATAAAAAREAGSATASARKAATARALADPFILYVSDRTGSPQIYRVHADGTAKARLTSIGNNTYPPWSADGKRIYFTSTREGDTALWSMLPDGSDKKKVFSVSNARYYRVSPDERHIAYVVENGGRLHVGVDDHIWSSLPGDQGAFCWTDGGKGIVIERVSHPKGIYYMELGSTSPLFGTSEKYGTWNVSCTPQGGFFVSASTRDGNAGIYVLDISGKWLRRLTPLDRWSQAPTISQDGSTIAYIMGIGKKWGLYVTGTAGGSLRKLYVPVYPNSAPALSVRGKGIVFTINDGDLELVAMRTNGTHIVQLTHNSSNDWSPVWQPKALP